MPRAVPSVLLWRRQRLSGMVSEQDTAPCSRPRSTSTSTSPAATCRRFSAPNIVWCGAMCEQVEIPSRKFCIRRCGKGFGTSSSTIAWASSSTIRATCPSRSGMGSSSTYVVAMLQALTRFAGGNGRSTKNRRDGDRGRAGAAERDGGLPGSGSRGVRRSQYHQVSEGWQLSTSIRSGFSRERECDLVAHLMLFFPGRSRFSSDIASSVTHNIPHPAQQQRAADGGDGGGGRRDPARR